MTFHSSEYCVCATVAPQEMACCTASAIPSLPSTSKSRCSICCCFSGSSGHTGGVYSSFGWKATRKSKLYLLSLRLQHIVARPYFFVPTAERVRHSSAAPSATSKAPKGAMDACPVLGGSTTIVSGTLILECSTVTFVLAHPLSKNSVKVCTPSASVRDSFPISLRWCCQAQPYTPRPCGASGYRI